MEKSRWGIPESRHAEVHELGELELHELELPLVRDCGVADPAAMESAAANHSIMMRKLFDPSVKILSTRIYVPPAIDISKRALVVEPGRGQSRCRAALTLPSPQNKKIQGPVLF